MDPNVAKRLAVVAKRKICTDFITTIKLLVRGKGENCLNSGRGQDDRNYTDVKTGSFGCHILEAYIRVKILQFKDHI